MYLILLCAVQWGETLLLWASAMGKAELVDLLLKGGAQVGHKNTVG